MPTRPNSRGRWTPIIFLTASDTAENLITAIEAGGDDFMSKSVPELVLEAKMKAMARIAALRQRLSFANRKLEEQASRDGLTGLANRRHMDLRTDLAWDEALRTQGPLALFMIDMDSFRRNTTTTTGTRPATTACAPSPARSPG